MSHIDSEAVWNAVFGPHSTLSSVQDDADMLGMTIQDYTSEAIRQAIEQGLSVDTYDALRDLCRQLGVPAM
jgi:hypothetical protein